MVRSIIRTKYLPKSFWAEAIANVVYLLNRCLTKSVNLRHQVKHGVVITCKLSFSHFKVFGCIAYVHAPEQKRKKLDDRGEKRIFIRYDMTSNAYRLYNPLTKKNQKKRCRVR